MKPVDTEENSINCAQSC